MRTLVSGGPRDNSSSASCPSSGSVRTDACCEVPIATAVLFSYNVAVDGMLEFSSAMRQRRALLTSGASWRFTGSSVIDARICFTDLMVDGQSSSRTELVLAAIFGFALLGKASDGCLQWLEVRLQPWRARRDVVASPSATTKCVAGPPSHHREC